MGSRRTKAALRRRVAIGLAVWAFAIAILSLAAAIPAGPTASLTVDNAYPILGETVHFNASASQAHDQGNGRIAAYDFSFGDGTGTGWQGSPLADHAYAAVGSFVATVTVRDDRGAESEASVTMHPGSLPPPSQAPDLVPIQAQPSVGAPRVNESLNVTVTVLNRGGEANSATLVGYDVPSNGTAILVASVPLPSPIATAQTVSTVVGPIVFRTAGNHTLRFALVDVVPPESNGTDNELELRLVVSESPAGTGPGGGPGPAVSPLALGLGGAAVAAGAGASYLFLRRPPRGPLEPPPPSPPDHSPPPIWPP